MQVLYSCKVAVSQIAIENIRQAKQRELLEHRSADLTALDRRETLVPDLVVVGMAAFQSYTTAARGPYKDIS
jgi:hypothetical protein